MNIEEYKGVYVFAQQVDNTINSIAFELIGKGKDLAEALTILKFTPGKSAELVEKVVQSAAANAENNHGMNRGNLVVSEIYANQGPTLKRIRPAAKGSAVRIRKRTSHITIVLRESK